MVNDSYKGMFNGDFFKKKSVLSDSDISALQAYNAEITRGVRPSIAFHKTMKESSVAAQNMAKAAKNATVDIGAIPKVSKAATLGVKALSLAMNVGLTLAITTLISGITKMIGASEEMSQQASEATSKYKEQTSSIEEYKGKITELKTALSSENLTYEDARDKRNQLLEVQKQLIDTYGDEAKGIDLVNGSLDSQIEKLEKLNKQKRQEWENEVNKLSTGQQWQKWSGAIGLGIVDLLRFLDPSHTPGFSMATDWLSNFDNTTNIERIQKKVENFSKSIKFDSIGDELKSQLDSFEGVSFDGLKMTISGDAKTVSETVTQIQTQVIGSREDLQWLNQDLKDIYNSAKKIVDENWDTYNTALQNQILDDKTGLEYYGKLTEAYETYQEAVKDGDENTINEAKEGYAKILSDIDGSDMSDSFKKFFENMYPDISDIVDDWKFEVEIVPKINKNTDGLKDDIETVKGLTTEEISAAFENNGTGVTKDQWKAITDLNAEAQANGLDLTTFLEQLREAGYLVSQLDKDIEKAVNDTKNKYGDGVDWSKYFKDNSIDTQEEIDKWNKVTNGIDNAEDAMNAYAEATKNANKMTVLLSDLSTASEALSSLSKAFKELSEDGYITVDTLTEIQKATGLNDEQFEQYKNTLLTAKAGSKEFNDTLSELTYKILESKFATTGFENATKEEVAAILRENGVLNANEIAHEAIAKAKMNSLLQSDDFAEKTDEEKIALIDEAMAATTDALAIQQLSFIKDYYNSRDDIDTSAEVTALMEEAQAAGMNAESLVRLAKAKEFLEKAEDAKSHKNGFDHQQYMKQAQKLLESPFTFTLPDISFTTPSSSTKNEALDNYLKEAESRYKIHQNETKYIDDLNHALSNLAKTDEERLEITEKINEAYRDSADNTVKDLEHQIDLKKELYGEDYNPIEDLNNIQRVAHEEANRLRSMGYDDNSKEIQDLQKIWWDAENSKLDFYSKQHENLIRDIEHKIDIDLTSNPFADVTAYYEKMQEYYHTEAERLRALDPVKYAEEIQKLQMAWWDAEKEKVEKSNDRLNYLFSEIERHTSKITNELQEQADAYDILIDKGQALVDAEQKMYESQAGIRDIQKEIRKELETNKALSANLSESEKKLLFNDEDYNKLNNKLESMSKDIGSINAWYNKQINSLTEENWYLEEAITKEYERRLEAKEKEYEMAKAELDIEKKKLELNNILNEKNIRLLSKNSNGEYEWKYVHDTEEASRVIGEISDLESEISESRLQFEQQLQLDKKQAEVDQLNSEKAAFENRIKLINEETEDLKLAIENITDPLYDFGTLLSILNANIGGENTFFDISEENIFSKVKKEEDGFAKQISVDSDKIQDNTSDLIASNDNLIKSTDKTTDSFNEVMTASLSLAKTLSSIKTSGATSAIGKTSGTLSAKTKSSHSYGYIPMGNSYAEGLENAKRIKAEAEKEYADYRANGGGTNTAHAKDLQDIIDRAETRIDRIESTLSGTKRKTSGIIADYAYDNGGSAFGKGFMFKDTDLEEMVLNPVQTDYFKNFVDNIEKYDPIVKQFERMSNNISFPSMKSSKSENYYFNGTIQVNDVQNGKDFAKEFYDALKHNAYKK